MGQDQQSPEAAQRPAGNRDAVDFGWPMPGFETSRAKPSPPSRIQGPCSGTGGVTALAPGAASASASREATIITRERGMGRLSA